MFGSALSNLGADNYAGRIGTMKGRANKTGRSDKTARHIRIYHMTLRTAAWKSLDAVARALYIEILSRYGGPGSNNGRIPYSIREGAAALRIGKTKSAVGLKDLQDRGFIAAITRGGFNRKNRRATEWRITEFACDVTGALPTYDYQRWSFQNAVPHDGREVLIRGQHGTHPRTKTVQDPASSPVTVPIGGQSVSATVSEDGHLLVYQGVAT
jgi:hypothetical protein